MAIVLLDTTVASFLHPKKADSPQRQAYEPHLLGNILALSFQSVAELYLWAEERRWGVKQRAALEQFLDRFLIVPYHAALTRTWAVVMRESKAGGRRLEAGDAWIAATAVQHKLMLLSHDRDFADLPVTGLKVICHAPPPAQK